MVVVILCLVCFCMLVWVMLLKAEITRLTLKYGVTEEVGSSAKRSEPHQKGMRRFTITSN